MITQLKLNNPNSNNIQNTQLNNNITQKIEFIKEICNNFLIKRIYKNTIQIIKNLLNQKNIVHKEQITTDEKIIDLYQKKIAQPILKNFENIFLKPKISNSTEETSSIAHYYSKNEILNALFLHFIASINCKNLKKFITKELFKMISEKNIFNNLKQISHEIRTSNEFCNKDSDISNFINQYFDSLQKNYNINVNVTKYKTKFIEYFKNYVSAYKKVNSTSKEIEIEESLEPNLNEKIKKFLPENFIKLQKELALFILEKTKNLPEEDSKKFFEEADKKYSNDVKILSLNYYIKKYLNEIKNLKNTQQMLELELELEKNVSNSKEDTSLLKLKASVIKKNIRKLEKKINNLEKERGILSC